MDDASPASLRRWRRMLADERAEAQVYRELAARRDGEEREILLGLAEAEERHAAHWENLLGDRIGRVGRGATRMRLLAMLARRCSAGRADQDESRSPSRATGRGALGVGRADQHRGRSPSRATGRAALGMFFVLALAQRAETRSPYGSDGDATPAMAADERVHEEVVRGLAARGRARVSGTFRAAVFGANDGLVSNLALVLGVTGGGASAATVLLTGLTGLLAGALSMGAGEYVSVRSQRELLAASAPDTRDANTVLRRLDVDANELALVFRARGMEAGEAGRRAVAALRSVDPAGSVTGGAVPDDGSGVVGTGFGAAASSFVFFASGAAVPVLPIVVGLTGVAAILVASVLVGLALMLTGATVGVLSGGPPLRRALRQLGIGAGAAGVTYGLGLLFGVAVG